MKPTLSEIKNASVNKKDNSILLKFCRPVGFYFAWFFIRIGLTPLIINFLNLTIGIIICILFGWFNPIYRIPAASLLLLWQILDTSDGNMARALNIRSNYGGFIDYAGSMFILAFIQLNIGIGLYRFPEGLMEDLFYNYFHISYLTEYILIISAYSSISTILCRLLQKVIQIRFDKEIFKETQMELNQLNMKNKVIKIARNIEQLGGLQIIIILLSSIIGFMELTVVFYFFINIIMLTSYTTYVFWSLRKSHSYIDQAE